MTLFLIGYAGSGKSSMGKRLAQRLGYRFVDTDRVVEQNVGASIADIFYYEGEEYFRRAERSAIEDIVAVGGDIVVATGGGLPVWSDNMSWMNQRGVTIYLRRDAGNILSRLSAFGREKRPMFRGKSDGELLAFMEEQMTLREPYYLQARICIHCSSLSDDEALDKIVESIEA